MAGLLMLRKIHRQATFSLWLLPKARKSSLDLGLQLWMEPDQRLWKPIKARSRLAKAYLCNDFMLVWVKRERRDVWPDLGPKVQKERDHGGQPKCTWSATSLNHIDPHIMLYHETATKDYLNFKGWGSGRNIFTQSLSGSTTSGFVDRKPPPGETFHVSNRLGQFSTSSKIKRKAFIGLLLKPCCCWIFLYGVVRQLEGGRRLGTCLSCEFADKAGWGRHHCPHTLHHFGQTLPLSSTWYFTIPNTLHCDWCRQSLNQFRHISPAWALNASACRHTVPNKVLCTNKSKLRIVPCRLLCTAYQQCECTKIV